MKKPKLEWVALVDLDGTLCDYNGAMRAAQAELAAPGERVVVHGDEPLHMTARRKLIQSVPGFWRNLKPLTLGMELLRMVRRENFAPTILTKGPSNRSSNAWTEKVDWCREHVPGVPVTITEDKGLVYGKILVDDWPPYIERWLTWRRRGFVFMPDQPWNQGFEHPQVLRVRDVQEDLEQAEKAMRMIRAGVMVLTPEEV